MNVLLLLPEIYILEIEFESYFIVMIVVKKILGAIQVKRPLLDLP
jgi:hypothetical protein